MASKKTLSADELDAKLKKDLPPVGDVWAAQIAGADDDDAEAVDNAAVAVLDSASPPEDADAFEELSYERTGDEDEPQKVEDFPAVQVTCQLQNVSYRPRSNGLGIFLQFETSLDVVAAIAKIKGADLSFDKLLLGHGATMVSLSTRGDADGNLRTKINLMLPQSELMRADPRPLILKTAVLRLEPAQLEFDLTARAE